MSGCALVPYFAFVLIHIPFFCCRVQSGVNIPRRNVCGCIEQQRFFGIQATELENRSRGEKMIQKRTSSKHLLCSLLSPLSSLLSSPLLSSPLLSSPRITSPLLASPYLISPLLSTPSVFCSTLFCSFFCLRHWFDACRVISSQLRNTIGVLTIPNFAGTKLESVSDR